jgi:hypothetical protein
MQRVFEGEELNGETMVKELTDPEVSSITLTSGKSPSIGFLETCHKDYGFYTDYSKEINGKFETRLVREDE